MSLVGLMETRPLQKVIVQMITDNCGLTRQTFYNHFIDKYDVVNWMFRKVVNDAATAVRPDTPWETVLGDMLASIRQHRKFYINALNDNSQNSLGIFMREYTRTAYDRELQRRISKEELDDELAFSTSFNSYGAVGVISEWMSGGMNEDPYRLAIRIADNMPKRMRVFFI